MKRYLALSLTLGLAACGGGGGGSGGDAGPAGDAAPITATPGVKVRFDLTGSWKGATFFDFPFPADVRRLRGGEPDVAGFPNPKKIAAVAAFVKLAGQRPGFPVVPVAYFRFEAPVRKLALTEVQPAKATSPVLLLDVDPKSPARGTFYPTVATVLDKDGYVPLTVLAVAPRPGIVLVPGRRYAMVVRRSLKDAKGELLGVPLALNQLKRGKVPSGKMADAVQKSFADLWPALRDAGVKPEEVAAATVFTTGDVVADTARMAEAVARRETPRITGLKLDPKDGDHSRYCELLGSIDYPQFQQGKPPFATGGLFALDATGLPRRQRSERAPVVISVPKKPMPAGGYPLTVYVHGSGGLSSQVVDRGRVAVKGGKPKAGEGPAHVLGAFGIATAGSAMPLNPERLKGATAYVYVNPANFAAFRDTFRQGAIEGHLFIAALKALRIAPSALGSCKGGALPAGETAYRFAFKEGIALMGQSMGGMYTNMIGATQKDVRAAVPTGAGGLWSFFLFRSQVFPKALIGPLLGVTGSVSFVHPVLAMLEMGWEPAEPIVYAARLGRRPLTGHPTRHVYEPVGKGDTFFSTEVFDAMALSYGHQQAGKQVWPSMQKALALQKREGIRPYPVKLNLKSETAQTPYTGVVVQYEGDGIYDPHAIAFQLDAVKYKYGCFLDSFFATRKPVVPAPAKLGTACPR